MSITIPRLNSQTRASTTPAAQTAVESDIQYRDPGIGDALVDTMKVLGEPAKIAKANKETGMANATINEFHRRMDDWYTKATTGKNYKGYDAENIMGDMRKFAYQTIDDLKLNGFTKADGSSVPALSEDVFNNKFLPSVDTMLINMDSNAIKYSSSEIAIAEENDFNNNIDRILLTVAGSDDPIVQSSASNELRALGSSYWGGRMSEESLNAWVYNTMNKGMGTKAKNLSATNPSKALHDFNTNPNYALYGVDLSEARAKAVESLAVTAGINEALAMNGLNPLPQDWTDQPLGEGADPVLRNKYPYSATALMTPQEYLSYSVKKNETRNTKAPSIGGDLAKAKASKDVEYLSEVGKVQTQEDYNALVERAAKENDIDGLRLLESVSRYKDFAASEQYARDVVKQLSAPDGSFNRSAATQEADIVAAARGITFASPEDRKKYENSYVAGRYVDFEKMKEKLSQSSEMSERSAKLLNDFYSKLYTSEAPTSPQEITGLDQMTPTDANSAVNALIAKAQTKQAADAIARNEGGTFDVYNLAAQQWTKFDKSADYGKDGKLLKGDAEARQRFIQRFVELYIRKHSVDKPNAMELEQLSIEAYNTYIKEPQYDDVSKLAFDLRRKAAESYEKANVTSFEERDRIRDFLETGHEPLDSERLDKEMKIVRDSANIPEPLRSMPGTANLSRQVIPVIDTLSRAYNAYGYLDFDSKTEQNLWDSLVEIYNEADYNGKETLIDFIVNGDNSSILRILKAKGKANG